MTHTPTPWETRELLNGDWVISQKGAATAHTTVHVWNGKEEKATAQFIIAACNAHDQLVNQLTELTDVVSLALTELDASQTGWYYQLIQHMQQSRKLLASIEKGAS